MVRQVKCYITKVVLQNDGSKTVHMHPMSKLCCRCGMLLQTILSGCVRLILAIGLCLSIYNLATSMKVTSLLELSKRTEECKMVIGKFTNDITIISRNLQVANGVVSNLNAEITTMQDVIQVSTNTMKTLFGRVKMIDERMNSVEWVTTNSTSHKLK